MGDTKLAPLLVAPLFVSLVFAAHASAASTSELEGMADVYASQLGTVTGEQHEQQ